MDQIMETQLIILQSCMWCNIANKRLNFVDGWHINPKTINELSVDNWLSQKSNGRLNPTYFWHGSTSQLWFWSLQTLRGKRALAFRQSTEWGDIWQSMEWGVISTVDWMRRHFKSRSDEETFWKSIEQGDISKVGEMRRHFFHLVTNCTNTNTKSLFLVCLLTEAFSNAIINF
jgi:hypothetical protein